MAYTRLPLFLGILFVFILVISIEVSARDIPQSADEENKVHVVGHLFGRNHHRCKHHGVGCKDYNPAQGKDTTSEEVENKKGIDAQEQAVEDNKVHAVKHLFFRNHHRCKHHGVGCKHHSYPQEEKDTTSEEVENKQEADAQEQAMENNKVHVVKHLFGHFHRHHHCKHYGGPGCKQESPQDAGQEATNQEVDNQGIVNTEDQKDVSNGGGKN